MMVDTFMHRQPDSAHQSSALVLIVNKLHSSQLGVAPIACLGSGWHVLLNACACQGLHDVRRTPDAVVEYARILWSAERHTESILSGQHDSQNRGPAQPRVAHSWRWVHTWSLTSERQVWRPTCT